MERLGPDLAEIADRALETVSAGRSVYVEGPIGSGRTSLVKEIERRSPNAVVVELLALEEVDAPAVALLETAAALPPDGRPRRGTGTAHEAHASARQVVDGLAREGKFLVLRLPEDWRAVEHQPYDDVINAIVRRARALLDGLLEGRAVVVVADAAITSTRLGFHPELVLQLRPYKIHLEALAGIPWGTCLDAYERLQAESTDLAASPYAWRLAVGLVALGESPRAAVRLLRAEPPIPGLVREITNRVKARPRILEAVTRLLAIRRPIDTATFSRFVAAPPEQVSLMTQCLGYGAEQTRVAPPIRAQMRSFLDQEERTSEQAHEELARHYAGLDGANDVSTLGVEQVRSWCEKTHHLALSGAAGLARWNEQVLPSPEFYWDKARHLSIVERDYSGAAEVYRRCTEAFPQDDYAWHYMAFNLQRAGKAREGVEAAYRKAIELDLENPWWNSRLVTFLIGDAQPAAARLEWSEAIARVDPDGDQLRNGTWLAKHLYRWVAEAWLGAGRAAWAVEVLGPIPQATLQASQPLLELHSQASMANPGEGRESPSWSEFLSEVEVRCALPSGMGAHVRATWAALRAAAGPELPLPLADRTADGERFQFAWSYRSVLVEVEVHPNGAIEWFSRDRVSGAVEGSDEPSPGLPEELRPWLDRVIHA